MQTTSSPVRVTSVPCSPRPTRLLGAIALALVFGVGCAGGGEGAPGTGGSAGGTGGGAGGATGAAGTGQAGSSQAGTGGSSTGASGSVGAAGADAGGTSGGAGSGDAGTTGAGGVGTGGSGGGGGGRGGGTGVAGRGGTGGAAGRGGTTGTGGTTGAGGSGGMFMGTKTPGTAQTGDITINPATTYQTMDGFGIADVWQSRNNSTSTMTTLLFDPVNGIGLTLLRIGIDENGKIMGDAAFVDGPAIAKFGGKIWAAPWSPPASSKDNNNINNGGHLLTSAYESWSSTLAAFAAYYKQQSGVDLWGLSAQNEPDFTASYRSCIFNSSQMNAFIKVLGPKLAALNPPVRLIAAEPDTWGNMWGGDNFGNAILNDATVSSLVTVIATHDYGSNTSSTTRPAPPAGANMTHRVWQTEITYSSGAAINAGLDIARGIYAGVTAGGANGWLYWWTQSFMDGGSASNPPKRVYAMGNFSKFVRPGYVRIGISGAPSSVQIVPFINPTDGTYAIVALNSGSSAQQVSFFVSGAGWPGTVTPYVTSASSNLVAGTAMTVSGARFSGSLAAQSVTTFVGKQ